jgi:hypothetical protein
MIISMKLHNHKNAEEMKYQERLHPVSQLCCGDLYTKSAIITCLQGKQILMTIEVAFSVAWN